MFLHLLPEDHKAQFLRIAHLVSMSDNPLRWDGKREAELTGVMDLRKMSLHPSEQEEAVLQSFARECGKIYKGDSLAAKFVDGLRPLTLSAQNDANERIRVASALLDGLMQAVGVDTSPSVPKVMLFELMLLALADGQMSPVEGALLKRFAVSQKLEDFMFDDLLERADALSREAGRALTLVLE